MDVGNSVDEDARDDEAGASDDFIESSRSILRTGSSP